MIKEKDGGICMNDKTIDGLQKIYLNVGKEKVELEKYINRVKGIWRLVDDHTYLEWDINTNLSGQHIISTKVDNTILNIFLEIGEEDEFACMIGSEFKLLNIERLNEFLKDKLIKSIKKTQLEDEEDKDLDE